MCIICIGLEKEKLSPWEAERNLGEMTEKIGEEHAAEVKKKISELIFEENSSRFVQLLRSGEDFCEFCDKFHCNCD